MRVPPLVARVRLRGRRRSIRLWIPLFLLWLVLAVLLAPLLALVFLAALVAPPRWRFLRLAGGAWGALCEARGASVHVEDARGAVFVSFH